MEQDQRTDSLGRSLLSGEDQMPDGRYRYRYKDTVGKRRAIYSWRLLPSDKGPPGTRTALSLREREETIIELIKQAQGEASHRRATLDQWFWFWLSGKPMLKPTTKANYRGLYTCYVKSNLGERRIKDIRYSDINSFYIKLLNGEAVMQECRSSGRSKTSGIKFNSLRPIHAMLQQVFRLAVRDGDIRTNPCDHVLRDLKNTFRTEQTKRRALTEAEQELLITFLAGDPHYKDWLPMITVFLGTGLRIGELTGLRWQDCDFNANLISVNHSLLYGKFGTPGCRMQISTPKSASGRRTVPMLKEVRETLLMLRQQRSEAIPGPEVDGYSGFVFLNRNGNLYNPSCINRALERIRASCNQWEAKRAVEEMRQPQILPHFSAHIFRHTFCTRFCENETNIKVIQGIMGHSDIRTTMNIYAEATEAKKILTMQNLEGKIRLR